MEFEIKKCNLIILKRGIKDEDCNIMLPNDLKISSLKEGDSYKYLGKLEAEDIHTKNTKEKVKVEYGAPKNFLSQNAVGEISSKL